MYLYKLLPTLCTPADSLQHMLRVHNEGMAAKERGTRGDLRAETDWRSRKFLSE